MCVLALGLVVSGCADPCFDDGLDQGGCPTQDTDTDGASASDSQTESAGSMSDSQTATETDPTVGTDSGGGLECPTLDEVLLPKTPTIQLVVDQSGSMEQDFGGVSRWQAVKDTLVNPEEGVVTDLQSSIRFGLTLYTGEENQCPALQELSPQLDAVDEITTVLDAAAPSAETPTGESLAAALQTLEADTWDGEKFLVLATDGEPDTCAIPNPMTDMEREMARSAAVQAVEAAYAAGIRTFVISVGDEVSEEHLQDLANAGVGNDAGDEPATFYTALDQASLAAAFQEIVAGVRECKLDLPMALPAEAAPTCTLTINDTEVPYDDPNGWALDGETQIELQGSSCTAIQDGVVAIAMSCTCEVN